MKKFCSVAFALLIFPILLYGQKQIDVKTEVSEATVFINGAQVLRKKTVDLLPGKSVIKFSNLSPYIDAKSVQVKAGGEVMVTSVNHQINYLDSLKRSSNSERLEKQLYTILDKIDQENTSKSIIKEELDFLNENRKIGGSNNGVSLTSLRETSNYYRERISALKTKDLEVSKKLQALELEKNAVLNEQRQLGTLKPTPIGEVIVEVECSRATRANFDLTYYVKNAGWYPTYDIRAVDISSPIDLVYKANVRQNTKEDWKNIKLKVSSADPNLGNVVPQLKTYYLNYYTAPPRYDVQQTNNNEVTGVISDQRTNEPLIGVSINIPGTTIGAISDVDGRFSLVVPQNATTIKFSYIGYKTKTLPVSRTIMNVTMEEDQQLLEEVVVGYGSIRNNIGDALQGRMAGISAPSPSVKKEAKRADIALPTAQIENQTAVEFEIKIPYTIKSDNKNTTIEVDRYELPADYEYFCIPKVNKDAFLLANIVDWEKYNLLEGEANIFFENTYIGKTILDVRQVSDTLNISLGRDKNVVVNREKEKEYNTKKFFGNKKEDTRVWKITARNNKKAAINFTILDQVPVSTNEEIEVSVENTTGGAKDDKTGEIKWNLQLNPSEKKELELKYKVKYPKSKTLSIE